MSRPTTHRLAPRPLAVLITVLFAVIAAAVAGGGNATPPARSGLIAYQRYVFQDRPLQADIFAAEADGSGQRRVTRAPHGLLDGEPDSSPDGRQSSFSAASPSTGPARSGASTPTERTPGGLHPAARGNALTKPHRHSPPTARRSHSSV